MIDRRFVRGVLAFLAIGPLIAGIWAVIDPLGWYKNFPGLGRHWILVEGPFDRHLVIDSGAGFLAVGVLALVAMVWAKREVIQVALVAYLFNVVPHFVYHLIHRAGGLSTTDRLLSVGNLGVEAALAVITLIVTSSRPFSSSA